MLGYLMSMGLPTLRTYVVHLQALGFQLVLGGVCAAVLLQYRWVDGSVCQHSHNLALSTRVPDPVFACSLALCAPGTLGVFNATYLLETLSNPTTLSSIQHLVVGAVIRAT